MTKAETMDYIQEIEDKLGEAKQELLERPERLIAEVHEVTIENSWQSDSLGALGLSLSKAQGELESVGKGASGYNYKYATLADTIRMIKPTLVKHELAITQLNVSKMIGKTLMTGVKTVLIHSSGEWISSESYLPTVKTKSSNIAQAQGSFQSYGRRYGIMSILNLATEDKDGTA